MPAIAFSSGPRTDRSFSIGLGCLVAFAIMELAAVAFYYVGRIRPPTSIAVARPTPAPLPSAAPSAPPVALSSRSAVPLPVAAPAISPATSPSTAVISTADRLLKEAAGLRARGDTTMALARLQEASEKDPKNGQVLAEMATIYESMQDFTHSNATWQRIMDIGPSAGPAYELAEATLKNGPIASNAAAPPLAPSSLDSNTSRTIVDGIPPGATLGITEVTASETPDPDADTNLMVRIAVKKRPSVVIDHTKVKIQVFFYDTVGDNDVKLTDADVSYEWLTPNHDWANADTETLAVTYIRPKNRTASSEAALSAAAAAINPAKKGKPTKASPPPDAGQRKYLGYIVRVYYNDQLQDKRADPSKLLSLFPAPNTVPTQ